MAEVQISVWEQEVYTFGIELPIPELPDLPEVPALGIELNLKATCPGSIVCGNPDAATNCSIGKKFVFSLPIDVPPIPIPPIPALPPLSITFTFPPKIIIPINCPNYPLDGQPEGT